MNISENEKWLNCRPILKALMDPMKQSMSTKIAGAGPKIQGTSQQPLLPCLQLLFLTGKIAAYFVQKKLTSV